ncbi:DTW domain-containing protein [Shewanella aestuarii]|uniref:tRNA-uridine aminocarboxypropyltransferase n=2 Tax=Shewanella aestuarii TaxID=1028752 RepID=A0A6G9QJR2_9GAMM|nr:DTW domain-containing protein [Shewanella aestuarii]
MKIILLTHSREFSRKHNTGKLVTQVLGQQAIVIEWQRTQPSEALLSLIAAGRVALLFPSSAEQISINLAEIKPEEQPLLEKVDHVIIIDSTWQEARKIMNQSPYLQHLQRFMFTPKQPSIYHLRRNQVEEGLCTAECAAQLLIQLGHGKQGQEIMTALITLLAQH